MPTSRNTRLANIARMIEMETLEIYEDWSVSWKAGVCTDESHRNHKDKFMRRPPGEYHKRCHECVKCVLGTKPEKGDGALELASKSYDELLLEKDESSLGKVM